MKFLNQVLTTVKTKSAALKNRVISVLRNTEGDQITGWLIVILLVVVVGAFFLKTYQSSIVDIWNGIVQKAKSVFGI